MTDERAQEELGEQEVQWRELGSFGPRVPPGPVAPAGADRGAGGSLLDQLRSARGARRAGRTWPLSRPYLLLASSVAVAVLGVATALVAAVLVGVLFIVIGGVGAAVGGVLLRVDARVEAQLRAQLRRERQLARELEGLTASGWHVLNDRVLPGGHHRVSHLAVGPAGVAVVTPLPAEPLQLVGALPVPGADDYRQLYAGPVHLGPWLRARRWEIEQLEPALADVIEDAVWSGPTMPLAVQVPDRAAQQAAAVPDMPYDWDGVVLRPLSAVTATLRGLPSPLSPPVVAELAENIDRLCPPATSAAGQDSSNRSS